MNMKRLTAISLALILALATFGMALAEEAIPACESGDVTGTVLSYDAATGQIVLLTENGTCTVSVDGEYDHPITGLFDDYFGADESESLTLASENLQGSVVWISDETTLLDTTDGDWVWVMDATEGESLIAGTSATITSLIENADGTLTVELAVEGETDPVYMTITDPDQIAYFLALYEAATLDFFLVQDADGNTYLSGVGDEVQAYHDDGMGFGVLAKFYSWAADTDMTVEELVSMFKGHTGLGLMFQDYGKPSMLGVGHIRQAQDGVESQSQNASNGKPDAGAEGKQNNSSKSDNHGKPESSGKPDSPGKSGKQCE